MNAVSPPPAGWYPDPSGRAPFRYWDGSRWTEHTDQGTAPSPSPASPTAPPSYGAAPQPGFSPAPPAPYAPAAPAGYAPLGAPYAPVGAPAAPSATGARWTNVASFVEDLKKADGFALVVVGALLFLLLSFLPWASASLTTSQGTVKDSSNAWNGDTSWLIRGWDVTEANLAAKSETGKSPESGTDMVILLPILAIAAGAAVASRMGKRVSRVNEIVLGASGLLALLSIAEVVHLNGAIDDLQQISAKFGVAFSGSVDIGLYLAVVATLVMVGGAAKTYLANRNAPAG